MDRLTIWGNGDSLGVPRVYCDCEVCTEARAGGRNRRLRSSVLVESGGERLLIDCGPDWRTQMEHAGMRKLDRVLLTHAHFDHFAGLPEWADACRWRNERGRLDAPASVLGALRRSYSWLGDRIDYHEADDGLIWAGWRIDPHTMCHGKNGLSYAYRFSRDGFRWAYCSDAINLREEEKRFLADLDLLILGTSFYREEFDMSTRSVYDMVEALELLREIRPGRTLFTHMSHDVDVRKAYPLPDGVQLAERGMQVLMGSSGA